jgi:hypothetical protein
MRILALFFEGGHLEMFHPPSKYVREGIKAEVARPGVFLTRVVVLEYSSNNYRAAAQVRHPGITGGRR